MKLEEVGPIGKKSGYCECVLAGDVGALAPPSFSLFASWYHEVSNFFLYGILL